MTEPLAVPGTVPGEPHPKERDDATVKGDDPATREPAENPQDREDHPT
ncbi:hypothetical protein ACNTMW_23015 [Planosporangium sp. 12N6]